MTSRGPRLAPQESAAATLATRLLHGLDTRLEHSAAVSAQIGRVAGLVEPEWQYPVKDAAWLHDVGYSHDLAVTSFHPLDGACWLREQQWPAETCRLVAWHTEALEEARLYGLDRELAAEFDRPPRLAAALAWADLTSSPSGERWDAERRLLTSSTAIRPVPSSTKPCARRPPHCGRQCRRSKTCSAGGRELETDSGRSNLTGVRAYQSVGTLHSRLL